MAQATSASSPQSFTVQEATTRIVALINSSPWSPRQEEIEAVLARIGPAAPKEAPPVSDLRIRIRQAMAREVEALDVSAKLLMGPECDRAEAELALRTKEIAALEKEIPNPPQCYEDLVARAEVARHGGYVTDGKLMEAEDEKDVFLGPAGRLVEAVLQFGGASPAAMSPAHAAHYREWRRLIDQHMQDFAHPDEAGMTKAESDAEEARMGAHMDVISALMMRIYGVPARTWGDVALYAQAFAWQYWPGVDLDGPEARPQLESGAMSVIEDHDLARLLEAIFSVAGIGQFAEVRHG